MKKMLSMLAAVPIFMLLIPVGEGETGPQKSPPGISIAPSGRNMRTNADYGKMPIYFIPNRGQMDKQVAYYVQGKDKTLYFTEEGITFALTKPGNGKEFRSKNGAIGEFRELGEERLKAQEAGPRTEWANPDHIAEREAEHGREGTSERWAVKLEFIGANEDVRPIGEAETGAVVSYFKGKPEEWHAGLPTYSKIVYPNLWPGIDLIYYGTVNRLKYEFIVHPGADPTKIRLAYRGAESISVDGEGRLKIANPAGGFTDDVPVAYQERDGKRVEIKLANKMDGRANQVDQEPENFSYGFKVGDYDPSLPLILDPAILIYCGYLGGSSDDYGRGIAVDGAGNAYVTGGTRSSEAAFPVTVGPDLTLNDTSGSDDAFVAKVNAAGTALIYCGYIGGSSWDEGFGIAVDGSGNAYVTGWTSSTEATFPVTGGPDVSFNGGGDVFVAKVNAAGTALAYCGYIGGSSGDYGNGIAVDGEGNAYIAGDTNSIEATFPVAVGPDLSFNGGSYDAFLAKVNAAGTALVYCGYIGGSQSDRGTGIAVDASGDAYLIGSTDSTEATFPVAVGPDLSFNGFYDAFVAKVNAVGTALVYCGYIGGSSSDGGRGIAADGLGNAYVTGFTTCTEATFPVAAGPDLTYNDIGYGDAFVAKVNAAGTALLYCGYVGGSYRDYGYGIAVDGSGNAYVTGWTDSSEASFPVAGGPDVSYNGGGADAFVAKVNTAGTGLVYCGYIGGSLDELGYGIAMDGSGNAYVTGITVSTEATFPVIAGPDLTYNAGGDAFVAKISYWDVWTARHAVGDFDGDATNEAVYFGAFGAWIYDSGSWTQLTASTPESLITANVDGNNRDEIAADFGSLGLWLWNGGVWTQLSGSNAENVAAGDVDEDGSDEVAGDFGALGLWLWNDGIWTPLSGINADYVATVNLDGTGGDEIIGDFGPIGLWVWSTGVWRQLSGVDANYVTAGRLTGDGRFLVGDFGPTGLWIWSVLGGWTELSGMNADYMIAANIDADPEDEIVGDFGPTGLWACDSGTWTVLSGVDAEFIIRADVNGDGEDEIAVDFGSIGLWLWNGGSWSQLRGVNPEYILAADLDGDNKDEILADFGALGLWLWDEGVWSQMSAMNPE